MNRIFKDRDDGLTREILSQMLKYDPETGVFTWLVKRQPDIKPGRIAGCVPADSGYRLIRVLQRNYRAHRLAWLYMTGEFPNSQIDHANGDRADNRWKNLRLASQSQNNANAKLRKNNSTGLKGVEIHKQSGKWCARIAFNGTSKYLGIYDCPAAAHFAYLIAADKLHGEFARAA